ncbi:oligosaccharide flippase family protein [Metabacillus idriensis]|uniref:oligosaccharide flippase family protein n=1 Tax=Metabacillus idriensis TaxID=324768 RepID=UPI00174D3288|nr:oligosaccharide flippase family protein [Metabacillus idriensis]
MFKSSFIYFISKAVHGLSMLASLFIFSYLLTKEEYGIYNYVIATTALVNVGAFHWLRVSFTRFFQEIDKEDEDGIRNLKTNIITIYSIILAASFLVFAVLAIFASKPLVIISMGLILLIQSFYELNLELYSASVQPKKYLLALNIRSVVFLLLGVILALLDFNEYSLLISFFLGMLIPVFIIRTEWTMPSLSQTDKEMLRKLFQFGIPIAITLSLEYFITYSNIFFLNLYEGKEAVGIFSMSYNLGKQVLLTLVSTIGLASLPLIFRAYDEKDYSRMNNLLKKENGMLLFMLLPAAFGLMICAYPLFNGVLSPQYKGTENLFMLIMIGNFFLIFKEYFFIRPFQIKKKTGLNSIVSLSTALISIICNYILVPKYGVYGAAYTTIIAYGSSCIVTYAVGRKMLKYQFDWRGLLANTLSVLTFCLIILLFFYEPGIAGIIKMGIVIVITHFIFSYAFNLLNIRQVVHKKLRRKQNV